MDQTFNGQVGQVAGGDINNFGPVTYDQLPTEELLRQRKHFRSLIWAARKRLIFNLPNLFVALGFLVAIAYLLNELGLISVGQLSTYTRQLPFWAFLGFAAIGIWLPMFFHLKTRQREGTIIRDCQAHMRGIDITLNYRR